jgi:hypothetical protein
MRSEEHNNNTEQNLSLKLGFNQKTFAIYAISIANDTCHINAQEIKVIGAGKVKAIGSKNCMLRPWLCLRIWLET